MTTDEYLYSTEHSNRIRELAMGMVREPPSAFFSHQAVVLRLATILTDHVEPRQLGRVAVAPLDVVLDAPRALVLQPDVLFIAEARASIIQDQVWGAPDLVAEVMSPSSEQYDRVQKLEWYRQYGVREYWLVDPMARAVTVVDFGAALPVERRAQGLEPLRSTVLPQLETSPFAIVR